MEMKFHLYFNYQVRVAKVSFRKYEDRNMMSVVGNLLLNELDLSSFLWKDEQMTCILSKSAETGVVVELESFRGLGSDMWVNDNEADSFCTEVSYDSEDILRDPL